MNDKHDMDEVQRFLHGFITRNLPSHPGESLYMESKWESKCRVCGETIPQGQPIFWSRYHLPGQRCRHPVCVDRGTAPHTPYSRRRWVSENLQTIPVGLDLLFDGSIPVRHRILMAVSVAYSQKLPVSNATLYTLFAGTDSLEAIKKSLTRLAAEGKIVLPEDGLVYWKPENQPQPSDEVLAMAAAWLRGPKPSAQDWASKNISLGLTTTPDSKDT